MVRITHTAVCTVQLINTWCHGEHTDKQIHTQGFQEGVVVGFQNFAWASNSQKYEDSNKNSGTPPTPQNNPILTGK